MEGSAAHYSAALDEISTRLLAFLRAFEHVQETIHFTQIAEAQAQLRAASDGLFPTLTAALAALDPPPAAHAAHQQLSAAVAAFADATTCFVGGHGRDFGQAFVNSRQAQCRGLALAYTARAQLPALQPYWLLPSALASAAALEQAAPGVDVAVGLLQRPATEARAEYSLYVPENHDPTTAAPLLVCLHGGYGQGNEYLWTWLRVAKSCGYVLLAPKSQGPTWSMLEPAVDIRSVQAMLREVCATYNIDRRRIYLSGLSDGGTFAYLLGFACAPLFAGIAPIAGVLHPMTDELLRRKQGIEVPLLVIHGALDRIFDVGTVRSTCKLLTQLGYQVHYIELPEWGHAYTYTLNEQRVLPWFEALPREC